MNRNIIVKDHSSNNLLYQRCGVMVRASASQSLNLASIVVVVVVVVVAVITRSLPQDGDTARTTIQVHAVNLIEIRLGERWQPISNQS